MNFIDQLKRTLQLKETPKRIVSLVPSQTELLVDLGLESLIFGVTKFCVHPNYLIKTKTVVGGTKQLHIDRVKALDPDIILCNKEENTKAMISELEAIAPVHVSNIYNLEDSYELISMYGELFQVEERAFTIVSTIKKECERFQNKIKPYPRRKVAYFIWKDPWMVAASNTFIDSVLSEAGFENIFRNEKRYPEISLDDSKLKATDALFLSSEPFPFKDSHVSELRTRFPKKEIKVVDGELFSWYGSRLQYAFEYFETLHDKIKKSAPN